MPLTWVTPQTGELFGPGYPLTVQSSLIGPIPSTYLWTVSVYSSDGAETQLIRQEWPALEFQQTLSVVLGDPKIPTQHQDGVGQNVVPSSTVRLIVDLTDSGGQRVDGDTRDVKWDPTGRLFALQPLQQQVQGGFTPVDRQALATTQDQTLVQLPTEIASAPVFDNPLADWLTLSHGTQYVRGAVVLLAGRGSLSVHGQSRGVAFGAVFSWFTVPLQLSRSDGLSPVYDDELLQVGLVYADGGLDLYYDRLLGFQTDGHFIEWPNLRWPERIDYWVFPGVQVAWQFMYVPH